jgi:hypothetical protein
MVDNHCHEPRSRWRSTRKTVGNKPPLRKTQRRNEAQSNRCRSQSRQTSSRPNRHVCCVRTSQDRAATSTNTTGNSAVTRCAKDTFLADARSRRGSMCDRNMDSRHVFSEILPSRITRSTTRDKNQKRQGKKRRHFVSSRSTLNDACRMIPTATRLIRRGEHLRMFRFMRNRHPLHKVCHGFVSWRFLGY